MALNYVYVATINGLPVRAKRRLHDLLRSMKSVFWHCNDDMRILRMRDDQEHFVDITKKVI